MAKVEGLATGDNTKADTLAQDLIDYRYEMARLERKRIREAKGQSFEEYAKEVVAQSEAAQVNANYQKEAIPKSVKEQTKTTNSLTNRIKAMATLIFLSLNTLMASCNISESKGQIKNIPDRLTKVEQTSQKANVDYTSNKFKYTIPNVEASSIKTGTIVNEYRSGGFSFKGRFVVMPNGALFNLQGRSVKITSKNIYAIENDRSGYFNLNDTKATKKVTPGKKISILNGEIVLVPDIQNSKKPETKKVVIPKKETVKPILKTESKSKIENSKTTNTPERVSQPIKVKYLDPNTGNYIDAEISLKTNIQKLERMVANDKKSIISAVEHGFYLNGKMYSAIYNRVSQQIEFYEYDYNKPESIINANPLHQNENPILLKLKYNGKTVYLRFEEKAGRQTIQNIERTNKTTVDAYIGNDGGPDDLRKSRDIMFGSKTIIKDQNGNLILKN